MHYSRSISYRGTELKNADIINAIQKTNKVRPAFLLDVEEDVSVPTLRATRNFASLLAPYAHCIVLINSDKYANEVFGSSRYSKKSTIVEDLTTDELKTLHSQQ